MFENCELTSTLSVENVMSLRPVIKVDPSKCINCQKCILVCPVKFCNIATGSHVDINHELCIGCGSCISSCPTGARVGIDDTEDFFSALDKKEKMIAIVAPSVAANFDGKYLELNGWLKSRGISAVFDVSFGAELTVKSYLEFLKKGMPKALLAQPCPALVSYIEIYQPYLKQFLAPADSPMAHTMKMVREFYPEYKNHKIAVISPCFAKRREFDAIGMGDYNVTMKALDEYFQTNRINLRDFSQIPYDGPQAERAVLFSTPGGLMRTVEREDPNHKVRIRKVEGVPEVYEYFESLEKALRNNVNITYKVLDCLNCKLGCNGGTATNNVNKSFGKLEYDIERRSNLHQSLNKQKYRFRSTKGAEKAFSKSLDKFWKKDLYNRSYVDRSSVFKQYVKEPSKEDLAVIHKQMHKNSEKDFLNCGACGYHSCNDMAKAIYNKQNCAKNCRHYNDIYQTVLFEESKEKLNSAIENIVSSSVERFDTNANQIKNLAARTTEMTNYITQSSASIEEMVANIVSINSILDKNTVAVEELEVASQTGKADLNTISEQIKQISIDSENLVHTSSVIEDIASQTNLLAMNAAIEAAHAGNSGRGFAVVADEIRKLAENSGKQAQNISNVLKQIKEKIDKTAESSVAIQKKFDQVVSLSTQVKEQESVIKTAVEEQNVGGKQVLSSLTEINAITTGVKNDTDNLLHTSKTIAEEISQLGSITNNENALKNSLL